MARRVETAFPNFRCAVARWLSPELGSMADRYLYMRNQVDDIHRWCAEFPDVSEAALWLLEQDRDHFRGIGEKPVGSLPWDIADLRERFRRRPAPTHKEQAE